MATTKLKIRNDRSKFEKTTIYVQLCIDGKIKLFSTGQKIEPDNWEPKPGRVKKGVKGASSINSLIDHEQEKIDRILRRFTLENLSPTFEAVEAELEKLKPVSTTSKDFFELFELFIKDTAPRKAERTLVHYRTAINHLKKFERLKNYKLTLESINARFYERFVNYLSTESVRQDGTIGLQDTSVGNTIKHLKSFLGWATASGYNINEAFRSFKVIKSKTEIITLTKEELERLFTFPLTQFKTLDRVRDLFVFGCVTGLRFSDISNLKSENIKPDYIEFTTVKTRDRLQIPLNGYSRAILAKYNNKMPESMSNQKMNIYLKQLGELVGIDSTEQRTKYLGSKRIDLKVSKYELITTHTARRTFITQSLERGVRPEVIMKITGHKDLRTMMRYVKVTQQVANMELSRAWNDVPSQLKVV